MVEQAAASLVGQGRAHQHGHDVPGQHAFAQAEIDFLGRQSALVQIFVHEVFIGLRDVFHRGVAQQRGLVGQILRHGRFRDLAVFTEHKSFARKNVHQADKGILVQNGHIEDHGLHAQGGCQTAQRHVEIGALAIHLIDEYDGGQTGSPDMGP